MIDGVGVNLYDKFIDVAGGSVITPVISSVTTKSLSGTCGMPLSNVKSVVIDIYEADPEGDINGMPQGKVYRGSFADNSAADSNPAVGAFTLNIASLGISSGAKVTITANYLKPSAAPSIVSVARSSGNTTLTIDGGSAPFDILRASVATGPYSSFTTAPANPATFADPALVSFYRLSYLAGGCLTTPFATSVTVP